MFTYIVDDQATQVVLVGETTQENEDLQKALKVKDFVF